MVIFVETISRGDENRFGQWEKVGAGEMKVLGKRGKGGRG